MTKYVTLTLEDIYYLLSFAPAMKDIPNPQQYMAIIAKVHGATAEVPVPMPTEPLVSSQVMKGVHVSYEVQETPEFFRVPAHANHDKIKAIKFVRGITGLGLKEAKDAVDMGTQLEIPKKFNKVILQELAQIQGITLEFY